MLPTLWPGDIAEIEACSLDDVRSGAIVFALREGGFFLHRFLARDGQNGFIARGDSMPAPDPAFPSGSLLGKLVGVTRAGQPAGWNVRPWSRAIGALFCHCSLARRIALRLQHSRNSRPLPGAGLETA